MRVLVTGAGGQVGTELVNAFIGTTHAVTACDRAVLDVTDRDRVLQVVGRVRPDVVVHAAAWTDVDGCERNRDAAYRVNALGTRHIAHAARLVGCRVCYISTDYVFDGTAGRAYNEWDVPHPLSVYGLSKWGGEVELGPEDTVVRTSWVFGRTGRNFVKTVLARARAHQPLRVVNDQHGCPTSADDLAAAVRRLVVGRLPGVFHVTNQGATTWYDFACAVVATAGLDTAIVSPTGTAELDPPRPAPRPAYAVLDNAALRLSGLPLLPDWHEPLVRLVHELS